MLSSPLLASGDIRPFLLDEDDEDDEDGDVEGLLWAAQVSL